MSLPGFALAALAFGADRYAAGQDGKTLLVGWRAGQARFAIAAGLNGSQDDEHFVTLARYLLRRDQADAYWLLLPADLDSVEHLVAEVAQGAGRQLVAAMVQRDATGALLGTNTPTPLPHQAPLGDLLDVGGTLPAIMRRELDRLADALAQPLPAAPG